MTHGSLITTVLVILVIWIDRARAWTITGGETQGAARLIVTF